MELRSSRYLCNSWACLASSRLPFSHRAQLILAIRSQISRLAAWNLRVVSKLTSSSVGLHPFKEQKLVVVGERGMAVFDDTEPEHKLVPILIASTGSTACRSREKRIERSFLCRWRTSCAGAPTFSGLCATANPCENGWAERSSGAADPRCLREIHETSGPIDAA